MTFYDINHYQKNSLKIVLELLLLIYILNFVRWLLRSGVILLQVGTSESKSLASKEETLGRDRG